MIKKNWTTLCRVLVLAAASLCSAHALAQGFPNKPVKIIVPYPAGGPVDGVARGYAERLSKVWNQPVIIDNRGGANEVIAADMVAKAPADGYTMLWGADASFSTNQFLFKKLPYNPLTDLVPVTRVTFVNMGLIVDGSLPVNNLKEFVALVKANPGKYNYGSAGAGSPTHIHFDAFLRQQGLAMTHIAYKGIAPAVQDMLGGQVQAMMAGVTAATPHLASGKMKILAINGNKRAKLIPNVPTLAEAGYPNAETYFFIGLAVPKGTPKRVIDEIASANRKVMADPAFVEKTLDPYAFEPLSETPEQFSRFLTNDRKQSEKKVREAGARLDS
ncbi:MAG: tripartite tricarboxylate transporter substrate binding protein [Polaromonas sp.]|uniref:Bug family tripartite tricarboxylate transporter substrate binding protein n=1 Tax=Polaromonas sp. TaxID=1869339 RepID=UPI0025CCF101|nr:tripartite tricarboxylate transporter substrate binding protein [Polaromonas sp.]MBI2729130.1 tripartite tricarboxylate transporter substrate binding protein [Polaromonas sp.]